MTAPERPEHLAGRGRGVTAALRESSLPAGAVLVNLLGVSYVRVPTRDGGDIYVVRTALRFLDHLQPESWYETSWFESHRTRLPGTSAVYSVPTKEHRGRALDLVVKYCRVGQFVPLDTRVVYEVLQAEFNGPFEEFALLEELRRNAERAPGTRIRFQEALAIYVPPERMQLWQTGRSEAKIASKLATHPGVAIDILRDYILVYRWLPGMDATTAFDRGLLKTDALESLTRRAASELARRGFRVLDMKPNHVILRVDDAGDLRREAAGDAIEYGLVDHELLQRTPDYEAEVQERRRREYLERARSAPVSAALPPHLTAVTILGVDYLFGRVESTGGSLWVTGREPALFDYFLPERWRRTPRIRLHAGHDTYSTRTKDRVDVVWKISRLGEPQYVEAGSAPERRALEQGVNSPFEEFALAALLDRAGVPVITPHAIYRTGHASHLEDRTRDWRRYRTHECYRTPDGEPVLQPGHDYITVWRYCCGEWTSDPAVDADYGAINGDQARRRGLLSEGELCDALGDLRSRIAAAGIEVLDLLPRQVLFPLDGDGRPLRGPAGHDPAGRFATRLCSFDFLKLPSALAGATTGVDLFVPPGALVQGDVSRHGVLGELVAAHEEEIVEGTYRRVLASGAPHYAEREGPEGRRRIGNLVAALRRAARESRGALVEHMRHIMEERLDEGFRLGEIQTALGCLEDELWQLCESRLLDRSDLVASLSMAAGLVGEAKDELARLYLERKQPAADASEALRERLQALFPRETAGGGPE